MFNMSLIGKISKKTPENRAYFFAISGIDHGFHGFARIIFCHADLADSADFLKILKSLESLDEYEY